MKAVYAKTAISPCPQITSTIFTEFVLCTNLDEFYNFT